MNNNVNDIKQFITNGGAPQQLIEKIITGNTNPIILNLINMAKNGDQEGVENFARNLFREQGRDFDKELNDFMSYFK